MCGILGYSSAKRNFEFKDIELISICNCFERGGDATGFYSPKNELIKDTKKAIEFLHHKKLKEDQMLIGHFRKKSIGVNTENNAHPFDYTNLVGVHNGTLTDYYGLGTKYKIESPSWFTDSQLLYRILDKTFVAGEFPDILSEYKGSAALLFYHKNSGSIYAYRDDQRPLYYGFKDDSMYISSLEYTLDYINCNVVNQFEHNKLYEIKDGEIINIINKPEPVIEPKVEEIPTVEIVDDDYILLASKNDINKNWNFARFTNEYSFKPSKQAKKFTGINRSVITTQMVVGYNLRYLGRTMRFKDNYKKDDRLASITKDNYYNVIDYVGGSDKLFKILDDNKDVKKVDISFFDVSNFIPVMGRIVILNQNIVTTGNPSVPVGKKGDMFIVNSHNFGDEHLVATSLITGRKFTINTSFINTLSKEEYQKRQSAIAILIKSFKEVSSEKTESNIVEDDNDLPFDVDDPKDKDDSNNTDDSEAISQELFSNLILELDYKIDEMIDLRLENKEVIEKLRELSQFIEKAYNIDFLIELLQNG